MSTSEWIQLAAATLETLGFAALFNVRGRKLIYVTLGGFLVWGVYLMVEHITPNPYLCGGIATVALTLYAEWMARIHKTPVTVFLVSAAIPLIPGAGLYRTMNCLMHRQWQAFRAESTYTLLFAASMAAGITLTTFMVRSVLGNAHRILEK